MAPDHTATGGEGGVEVSGSGGGEGVDGAAAARCSAQTLITPINHEEPGARTEESYFVLRNTAHALRRGEVPGAQSGQDMGPPAAQRSTK